MNFISSSVIKKKIKKTILVHSYFILLSIVMENLSALHAVLVVEMCFSILVVSCNHISLRGSSASSSPFPSNFLFGTASSSYQVSCLLFFTHTQNQFVLVINFHFFFIIFLSLRELFWMMVKASTTGMFLLISLVRLMLLFYSFEFDALLSLTPKAPLSFKSNGRVILACHTHRSYLRWN